MRAMPIPDLEEVRQAWNAFAPQFDARYERITLQLARVLIDQLDLEAARALLEVGCGAGGAARIASRRLPAGARQVATDLAPAMLERARAKLPESVEVREANAEALPFEDGSFDRLLANLSLMLVPDTDAALREAARVLAPGARMAFSVWGRPEGSAMFTLPPQAAATVGIEVPEPPRSNFHLGDRDALRERLAAHGFEQAVAWYHPMINTVCDAAGWAAAVLETPRWRGVLADRAAEEVERLRTELTRRAAETLASGSPIQLDALLVVARRR